MNQLGVKAEDLPVVPASLERAEATGGPRRRHGDARREDYNGKTSSLLGASSACLLNALKYLGGIPNEVTLIAPSIIEPIQHLKVEHMGNHNPRLHTDEVLIALLDMRRHRPQRRKGHGRPRLPRRLRRTLDRHPLRVDENVFQRLGMYLTCEPLYQTKKLYHGKK